MLIVDVEVDAGDLRHRRHTCWQMKRKIGKKTNYCCKTEGFSRSRCAICIFMVYWAIWRNRLPQKLSNTLYKPQLWPCDKLTKNTGSEFTALLPCDNLEFYYAMVFALLLWSTRFCVCVFVFMYLVHFAQVPGDRNKLSSTPNRKRATHRNTNVTLSRAHIPTTYMAHGIQQQW